jgi:DMSO/TMAO reductase YedYZ heme-binding membrane subunit
MSVSLSWDAARAGGLVAWGLATTSVVWGLLLSTRLVRRHPWPVRLLDLHRFLGALTVVFTGVHVGAILVDGATDFDLVDVFVPFAATWHPSAVAWGIVTMYLLLAVETTSLLRDRIDRRWWRRLHLGGFGVFVAGTVHAISAGTDTADGVAMAGVVIATVAVFALIAVRVTRIPENADGLPARTSVGPAPQLGGGGTGAP